MFEVLPFLFFSCCVPWASHMPNVKSLLSTRRLFFFRESAYNSDRRLDKRQIFLRFPDAVEVKIILRHRETTTLSCNTARAYSQEASGVSFAFWMMCASRTTHKTYNLQLSTAVWLTTNYTEISDGRQDRTYFGKSIRKICRNTEQPTHRTILLEPKISLSPVSLCPAAVCPT